MIEHLILPLVMTLLMFGLGLSLQLADFRALRTQLGLVVVSLVSILGLMPLCAWFLSEWLGLDPSLKMGMLLLATCPGGMFSNIVSHNSKADLPLSLTLTVCSSLIYAVVSPVAIAMLHPSRSGDSAMLGPLSSTVSDMVFVVLVPLCCGMLLRQRRPAWSMRSAKFVRNASGTLLAVVFIAVAFKQSSQFGSVGPKVAAAVVLLNVTGWVLAALLTRLFRRDVDALISIGAEHSIRQEGVGVFVAITVLGSSALVPPLLLNSILGLAVSMVSIVLIRWVSPVRIQATSLEHR
jgi:bile acid:Na+ symporter, BASS family